MSGHTRLPRLARGSGFLIESGVEWAIEENRPYRGKSALEDFLKAPQSLVNWGISRPSGRERIETLRALRGY